MFDRRYTLQTNRRSYPKWTLIMFVISVVVLVAVIFGVRQFYYHNLGPVSDSTQIQEVIIEPGMLAEDIASTLSEEQLIRNETVFQWYIKAKNAGDKILAGSYRLQPSMSTPQIVEIITKGQVSTELITIYPGQRIDEIREGLINGGFDATEVDQALNPAQYAGHPALVDKPAGASLEGYLYPESFQHDTQTTAKEIITQSLDEMSEQLTPALRSAMARRNLSMYQGIVLASIVEQEAHDEDDRRQIAQVFLSRLAQDTRLESDPTATYGAILAGQEPSLRYESPYNTYLNRGLPPTPISNVTKASLDAVASPASTDWLYFVAGDDGTTYFSRTLEEHERLTEQHCTTLCGN